MAGTSFGVPNLSKGDVTSMKDKIDFTQKIDGKLARKNRLAGYKKKIKEINVKNKKKAGK